jgi:hypothetical protein
MVKVKTDKYRIKFNDVREKTRLGRVQKVLMFQAINFGRSNLRTSHFGIDRK